MGYIQDLRKLIGSKPIIAVGATIVVYNKNSEILFQHRTDTDIWGLPGGSMEAGENIEETAKRELFEETGLIAKKLKLLNVLSGPEFFFVYPNGDQVYTVIVLYQAIEVEGDLHINDDESKELKYFNLDFLPELESRAENVVKWLRA
jgi:8-oxo-dGTP pyrophosphatase MutT (NUDIX family)